VAKIVQPDRRHGILAQCSAATLQRLSEQPGEALRMPHAALVVAEDQGAITGVRQDHTAAVSPQHANQADGPAHTYRRRVQVNVTPAQREQFAAAHASHREQVPGDVQLAVLACPVEEGTQLGRGPRLHLRAAGPRGH
jgi:hypothetical protein